MLKTKLVKDVKSCNFVCCGRTDAGVSALGQVLTAVVCLQKVYWSIIEIVLVIHANFMVL